MGINDDGCGATKVGMDRPISKYPNPLLLSLSPGDLEMGSVTLQEADRDLWHL